MMTVKRLGDDAEMRAEIEARFSWLDASRRLILITGHRRENFGDGFDEVRRRAVVFAQRFPDVQLLYPVHLNPNVRQPVFRILKLTLILLIVARICRSCF